MVSSSLVLTLILQQQAHVERAVFRANEEYEEINRQHRSSGGVTDLPRPPLSLFPRGAAACADARYIFRSCDAARSLLHICVDDMSKGGGLRFLPSRYLLWFTYAAIVLLKVNSDFRKRTDSLY